MNRRNYAKELNRIIEKNGTAKPTLLLHACCGPCASGVLEKIGEHFDITLLWYNPNLYPEQENTKRLDTLRELLYKMGMEDSVKIIEIPWKNEEYENAVKGLEQEPEGGKRCGKCFELRLNRCAEIAKERGFDYFGTTLTVSRHKNAELINQIGEEAAKRTGSRWLPSDFKKQDGENRSQKLAEQYQLYRQLYCGCRYSLVRRKEGEPSA